MAVDRDPDDPYQSSSSAELVAGANAGDERAWNEIVRRHAALVVSRIRQFRLSPDHADDVAQTVWLKLLEHLSELREPDALPGWIATTTRNECIRMVNLYRRSIPVDPQEGELDAGIVIDLDEGMLRIERNRALRDGLAELPPHQRELLVLLSSDPPLSYAEIAERLGVPIGTIGPTRGRGLTRLRQTTAIQNYLAAQTGSAFGEGEHSVLALG
jgi:RNA polymerase sigma factor (sigma-70 family)